VSAARPARLATVACVFVLACCAARPLQAAEPLRPARASASPVIDGKLDDDIWRAAPSVGVFKTWMPDYGADLSERTITYYAYDAENLYFAFRAFDREPSKIRASMASRDTIRSDDWICVNLDSFYDQQTLYSFYVNPLGIQMDSRFAANREDFGFDAVWYSAGRVDDTGYTIEMRIPFKSLRYAGRNPVTMGVLFERFVSRRTEDGTFPALDPKMGFNFIIQTTPIEYRDIRHYRLLEVLPAATYNQQRAAGSGRLATVASGSNVGVTATYGLTAQLTADGTYNPDFSQVEADAGQIDVNLRAPLYFPEKRPFFLEGLDVFNLGGPSQTSPLQAVVYTRTIVNPLAGVKVSGKLARRDTLASLYSADEPAGGPTDRAQVFIGRYKRALNQDAYLGAFLTSRATGAAFNRVAGGDGILRLTPSASLGFYALGSTTRRPQAARAVPGSALGVEYSRSTRELDLSFGASDISRDFVTETGYLTRSGVATVRAFVGPKFYPKRGRLQRVEVSGASEQTRDAFSGIWETYNEGAVTLRLFGATVAKLAYHPSTEVFAGEEFNTSGLAASVDSRLTKQLRLQGTLASRAAIFYSADPFGGHTTQASASIVYQPTEQWYQSLSVTYANFDRASDGVRLYDYTIGRSKTSFQVNRYLFFRAIFEYNAYRRQFMTDLLASFTYIPGTVLHAGYGSLYEKTAWNGLEYVRDRSFTETRRGLFLKASYLWRL
jgi:hypothetical protein